MPLDTTLLTSALLSFDFDIDASISTATRRSRDELFDVPLLSFALDIDASISR